MLQIDKVQQINDVTVYGDDKSDFTFYLVPQTPRFRLEDGKPVFKFIKYRELRKDGNDLFGGVCAFDTEFVVAPEKLEPVKQALQSQVNAIYQPRGQQPSVVIVGPLTYTGGTANLNIGEGSTLVEKVRGAGKPSLYGNNVATFWVELTKAGATVFEAALQGQGGFVSVVYDLKIWAKLPPVTARGWWHASQVYSFVQEINTEDNFWSEDSYEENIRETMRKNEVMGTEFNFVGNPAMSAEDQRKMEADIRSAVTRQLEEAVERNMLKEIEKTDPDTKSLREDQDIEDIKRTVSKTQIADVNISFKESQVIEWNIVPQGLLPNITTMKGPDGKGFNWADYALEVDLNDPFFQTLEVSVRVNADFANLPIFNVEAKLSYLHGRDHKIEEYTPTPTPTASTMPGVVSLKLKFIRQEERKKLTFHYNRAEATRRTYAPQGFFGLLLGDLADKDSYFTEVDLDDPFFREFKVQAEVPIDFARIGLSSAQVALDYGDPANAADHKHGDFVFREGDKGPKDFTVFLNSTHDVDYQQQQQFHFSPDAGWDSDRSSIELPASRTADRTLFINPYDVLDFLEISVTPGDIDAGIITSTEVTLRALGPTGFDMKKTFIVLPDSPPQVWKLRAPKPVAPDTRTVTFALKHHLKDGSVREQLAQEATSAAERATLPDAATQPAITSSTS